MCGMGIARTALVILFAMLVASLIGVSAAADMSSPSTAPTSSSKAAVVVLEGPIDEYNRDMLMRRFSDARAVGAKVVILQIDTYGGMVTAGLDISQFIKQQNDLHTIAFVHRKAISAGAMIAMACD